MSESLKIALIVAVAPTLTAIAALWATIWHHGQINSRMDQLMKIYGESEHAKGHAEGVIQERERKDLG